MQRYRFREKARKTQTHKNHIKTDTESTYRHRSHIQTYRIHIKTNTQNPHTNTEATYRHRHTKVT